MKISTGDFFSLSLFLLALVFFFCVLIPCSLQISIMNSRLVQNLSRATPVRTLVTRTTPRLGGVSSKKNFLLASVHPTLCVPVFYFITFVVEKENETLFFFLFYFTRAMTITTTEFLMERTSHPSKPRRSLSPLLLLQPQSLLLQFTLANILLYPFISYNL